MRDITRAAQRAAFRMEDAAAALERAVNDTQEAQARHDDLVRRIADLARARGSGPAPAGVATGREAADRAALASLSGRFTQSRRRLARQQEQASEALAAFRREREAFDRLFDDYGAALARLREDARLHQQREAAAMRALDGVVQDIWPGRGSGLGRDGGFEMPEESYGYIALDIPRLLTEFATLDRLLSLDPDFAEPDSAPAPGGARYRPVSFLEVGCGQGRNVLIARNCGLVRWSTLSGFDLNPVTVEGGRRHLGLGDALSVANALEVDYGGHDVIYFYRLFWDTDLQRQLEARIARTMDRGAYLIAAFSFDLALYPELEHCGLRGEIWKKTSDSA